jgi:hypothetical protein
MRAFPKTSGYTLFPERRVTPAVPDVSGPLPTSDLSVHSLFYGEYDVSGGWGVEHVHVVRRHFGDGFRFVASTPKASVGVGMCQRFALRTVPLQGQRRQREGSRYARGVRAALAVTAGLVRPRECARSSSQLTGRGSGARRGVP